MGNWGYNPTYEGYNPIVGAHLVLFVNAFTQGLCCECPWDALPEYQYQDDMAFFGSGPFFSRLRIPKWSIFFVRRYDQLLCKKGHNFTYRGETKIGYSTHLFFGHLRGL